MYYPQHIVRVKKIDDEEEEGSVLTEEEIMDLAQGSISALHVYSTL